MLQGNPNCQNILKKIVFNKICSGLTFCQNVPKILLKLKNKQTVYSIFLPLIIFFSLKFFTITHSFTVDLLDLVKWVYSKIIYQAFLRFKMHWETSKLKIYIDLRNFLTLLEISIQIIQIPMKVIDGNRIPINFLVS